MVVWRWAGRWVPATPRRRPVEAASLTLALTPAPRPLHPPSLPATLTLRLQPATLQPTPPTLLPPPPQIKGDLLKMPKTKEEYVAWGKDGDDGSRSSRFLRPTEPYVKPLAE